MHPSSIEHAVNTALDLWKAGKILEATQVCKQLLKKLPNEAEILYLFGHCEFAVGNLPAAQTALAQAVAAQPKQPKYRDLLKQVYQRTYEGHLTQAIISLKQMEATTPETGRPQILTLQQQLLASYLPANDVDVEATKLCVVGDRQSSFFGGTDSPNRPSPTGTSRGIDVLGIFQTYDFGPTFAADLGQPRTPSQARERLLQFFESEEISPGREVILCFGELDCRVNLVKQAKETDSPLQDVAERCVATYFLFVDELSSRGIRPIVWGPIPSQPDWGPFNYEFPRNGTLFERNVATKLFNEACEFHCRQRDIPFVSLFPQLVNPDGTTKYQYLVNGCHLSQRAMPMALELFVERGLLGKTMTEVL